MIFLLQYILSKHDEYFEVDTTYTKVCHVMKCGHLSSKNADYLAILHHVANIRALR